MNTKSNLYTTRSFIAFLVIFFLFNINKVSAQRQDSAAFAHPTKGRASRTFFSNKRLGYMPADANFSMDRKWINKDSNLHKSSLQLQSVSPVQPNNLFHVTGTISVTTTSTGTTCGYSNGGFTIHASGGTPPYTYSENGYPFQSSAAYTQLAPGVYNFIVKDAAGQTATGSVTLTNTYPPPTLSLITYVPPTVCTGFDGSVTVQANGGTPPYTYTDDGINFQSSGTFTNLSAAHDSYAFFVKDANGCMAPYNFTFFGYSCKIGAQLSYYSYACKNSGYIIVTDPSGGTAPYTYSLDGINYQASGNFDSVALGLDHIYVKDATGAISVFSVQLFYGCYLIANATETDAVCSKNDGSINVSVSNGTAPFQYSLDGINFQPGNIFNGLAAGNYTVFVTDANSSQSTVGGITIGSYCPPVIVSAASATCGKNDGSITATATTGTAPYQYSIDGIHFQAGNVFNSLVPGSYLITVKDAASIISVSDSIIITENCPAVTATETDETCNQKNGTLTASGSNGNPPYQYSIDGINFQTNNVFNNLAAGNYTVTIKDNNGSVSTTKTTIHNDCMYTSLVITNPTCGKNNGSFTVKVTSWISPPYQYSIDGVNFQPAGFFDNLLAGYYRLTVKNANNENDTLGIFIDALPPPQISLLTTTQASCSNTNGSINITAAGGAAPLQFSIDNGKTFQSNNIFNNLDSAQYIALIKDANGCTVSDTLQLTALPTPVVSLGNDTILCTGQTLLLSAPQAAGNQYLWQDNTAANNFTVTTQGSYSVKVTNQFGCAASDTININYKSVPAFGIGNDTILCAGKLILLQPSIVLLQAKYLWSTGDSSFSIKVNTAGLYWLQVSNSGCAKRDSIFVSYKPNQLISLGHDTILCEGQVLLLDATAANATYSWQDGSAQPTFTVRSAGAYSVSVRENGCDTSAQVTVNYITKPIVQLGKDTTLCITEQLLLNAAYPQSTYEWQDGSTEAQFTVTKAGTYSVDIANSCGDTKDSINITYENCACKFYVPSAFSPNHDGRNDVFVPKYQCLFGDYELKIFNRWGQLVFNSSNAAKGWDGTFNSQQQPSGSYVWEMNYTDNLTGRHIRKTGTVVLVR